MLRRPSLIVAAVAAVSILLPAASGAATESSMLVDGAELVLRATSDNSDLANGPYITTTEEGLVMKVKGAELVLRPSTGPIGNIPDVTCSGPTVEVIDGACVAKSDPALDALLQRATEADAAIMAGLDSCLEAHYPLDDETNWVRDATGRGHDGEAVGGVIPAAHPSGSQETVGACFPGTWAEKKEHHYFTIPKEVVHINEFAVSMWVYMEDPHKHNSLFKLDGNTNKGWSGAAYWLFTSHASDEPDHAAHVVGLISGYDTRYTDATQPSTSGIINSKASRGDVKAYEWVHVVATLKGFTDGETQAHEIYLNGKQTQRFVGLPGINPSNVVSSPSISIGDCLCQDDSHETSYEFVGVMRDIRVFTKALSPLEIRTLYTATMPPLLPESYQCGA